jgi:hypothetical protein
MYGQPPRNLSRPAVAKLPIQHCTDILHGKNNLAKTAITPHEFRQKLAALLRQQEYYTWEMSVLPAPAGKLGLTGSPHYDVSGGAAGRRVVELERILLCEYEITVM